MLEFSKRWEAKRLSGLFTENTNTNSSFSDDHALQYRYGEIIPKKKFELTAELIDTYSKYTIVRPGDLMINGLNLNYDFVTQRVAMVRENGIITSAYISLRPRDGINPKFYNFFLKSMDARKIFNGLGTGIRLTLSFKELRDVLLPIPPRSEQDQIVRYLDWQTSRINGLIATKRREIELLKEFKNAIVSYFVTHGLQNATIQKSEIYWLVGVPKSWRITKLKYVLQKHDRPIPDNASLLICSNNGEVKIRGDEKIGLVASNDDIYQGVAKGDLLIHGMDTWHGAIAISEYDGMCTPVVHVCTCTESKRFVAYYLKMMAYTKVFKAISNGIRQNTSDFRSWDKTGDLLIALPPIDEQEKISDLIDGKLTAINSTIEKCNKQISLLHELRTRLISDVVTGQIDVRGVTVPEFESIAEPPDDSAEEESAEYETEE